MSTKWYVIRSVTGKEKQVTEQLEAEIRNNNLNVYVKKVLMPIEKVFHIRNGKKVAVERNHYPGYILVETDPKALGELRQIIKNVNFATGFLGDRTPTPLRLSEVNRILGKMDELNNSDEEILEKYFIGEKVRIIDGAFTSFIGDVTNVNIDKKSLKMNVKVFGRETPIELKFEQVTKDISE